MQDKILPLLEIHPASEGICCDPLTNESCQFFLHTASGPYCSLFVYSLEVTHHNRIARCDKCLTAAFKAKTYAKIKELESCLS